MKKALLSILAIVVLVIVIAFIVAAQNSSNLPDQSASVSVAPGASGEDVIDLQEKLKGLGYYNGNITGYYGNSTQAAVQAFQAEQGLKVDGSAGAQTAGRIDAIVAERSWVQFASRQTGANCVVSPYGNQKDIEFGIVTPFNNTVGCLVGVNNQQLDSTTLNGDTIIKSRILNDDFILRLSDRTRQSFRCKGTGLLGVSTGGYFHNPPTLEAGSFQMFDEDGEVIANCVVGSPESY
jgi:hypothetical protein